MSSTDPMTRPTTTSEAVAPRFTLSVLAAAALAIVGVVLFVQLVDPYGVSPIGVRIGAFNEVKPKRVDIDRLIKPYEVWAKQPRTIFMGTSRIHQSIDPRVLDGSRLAPAYNAAIPQNNLGMNISHLRQYLDYNQSLRRVYAELFIYNFLGQPQDNAPQDTWSYVKLVSPLFFSLSAVKDAWSTVIHNVSLRGDVYQIAPGGNFHYPVGHDASGPFAGFPVGIWAMHPQDDSKPKLSDPSFARLQELADLAWASNLDITFLATPNHAYSDYYFEFFNAWDVVAEWLMKVSAIAPIVSLSQPNGLVYEPVSREMKYWYDPFHFSLEMGRLIQLSLAGKPPADLPANFMVGLGPGDVDRHIAERRQGIRRWAEENPDVAGRIAAEYGKWKERTRSPSPNPSGVGAAPDVAAPAVSPDPAVRVRQFAGAVESASLDGHALRVTGWAADILVNAPASGIVLAAGDRVVGTGVPTLDRPDIREALAGNARPAGFDLRVGLPPDLDPGRTTLQVYALFGDGTVARLNADLPRAAAGMIERYAETAAGSAEERGRARAVVDRSSAPRAVVAPSPGDL